MENALKGLDIIAPGCGTPLPGVRTPNINTLKGLDKEGVFGSWYVILTGYYWFDTLPGVAEYRNPGLI